MNGITNVGDIVTAVSASSLVATANEIGTNNKYLSKALRSLGYQSVPGKGWQYAGEGPAPNDMTLESFLELCKKNIIKVTPHNTNITEVTASNSNITTVTSQSELQPAHQPFTQNDITDLMSMLSEWRNKSNTSVIEVTETIFDRLQLLPKNQSTRKTYVIDEEVAAAFDAYCTKKNINKSYAITVALQDFLNKY